MLLNLTGTIPIMETGPNGGFLLKNENKSIVFGILSPFSRPGKIIIIKVQQTRLMAISLFTKR